MNTETPPSIIPTRVLTTLDRSASRWLRNRGSLEAVPIDPQKVLRRPFTASERQEYEAGVRARRSQAKRPATFTSSWVANRQRKAAARSQA